MVLSGPPGAVEDSKESRNTVLTEVKKTLWADKYFCYFIACVAARSWGITGTMAEIVKATTDTLDATVIMAEDPANRRATVPAYLITGRLPSNDKDEYVWWINYYTAPGMYWVDQIYQLKVNVLVVECKLCKDTTHCARDCPLAKVPGWQGPSTVDIYQPAQGTPRMSDLTSAVEPEQQAKHIWQELQQHPDGINGDFGTQATQPGGVAGMAAVRDSGDGLGREDMSSQARSTGGEGLERPQEPLAPNVAMQSVQLRESGLYDQRVVYPPILPVQEDNALPAWQGGDAPDIGPQIAALAH
ncbi:hypothetical protein BC628DRAFT_1421648 [Trametes gibbosa]|nr:hypothetical protein BC628DRAFT_1421648 [Trametes gibbosa]